MLKFFVSRGFKGDALMSEMEKYDLLTVTGKNGFYLPLDNYMFTVFIDEVICGKNITNVDFEALTKLCKKNGINIRKY
jgi:hypothetical protein